VTLFIQPLVCRCGLLQRDGFVTRFLALRTALPAVLRQQEYSLTLALSAIARRCRSHCGRSVRPIAPNRFPYQPLKIEKRNYDEKGPNLWLHGI
jgi:hypothetical protein